MKSLSLMFVLILVVPVVFAVNVKPVGFVNDFAGILTDTVRLKNELRMYEQNTTVEIAVVTIDSVPPGYTLFSYGVELFEEWGIGKKGEDNGLLILFTKNGTPGNRMRIEVGYGLQGYITGAEAGRMLDKALPLYEDGNYQMAVESILVDVSDELIKYQPRKTVQRNDNYDDYFIWRLILSNLPIVIFLAFVGISAGLKDRCPYCFGKLEFAGGQYACKKCGRKISRRKRYAPILIGGSHGGGYHGGGGGGFGGGSSGGGGAGR